MSTIIGSTNNINAVRNVFNNTELCSKAIDQIAYILNKSIYVIDYQQRKFAYVSSNELFLCGYTKKQVTDWGFTFYKRVISPYDLNRLFSINKSGLDFYYNLPIEERYSFSIEFDFELIHINKRTTRVIQKSTPLTISENGDILLLICIVSPSYSKEINKAIIKGVHSEKIFIYSEYTKTWLKSKLNKLTIKEQKILLLTSKGFTNIDIAKELSININTVKFHKRNIFDKLNVNNCIEAIMVASQWGLI